MGRKKSLFTNSQEKFLKKVTVSFQELNPQFSTLYTYR